MSGIDLICDGLARATRSWRRSWRRRRRQRYVDGGQRAIGVHVDIRRSDRCQIISVLLPLLKVVAAGADGCGQGNLGEPIVRSSEWSGPFV